MTTWGQFVESLRHTILQDIDTGDADFEFRFSEEVITNSFRWALDTFAQHTAVATSVAYTPADEKDYELPSNIFTVERLDQTGRVYLTDTSGAIVKYLDPVNYTPGYSGYELDGFYTEPETTLHLTNMPSDTSNTLNVRYFAYYTPPTNESDNLPTPRWADAALSFLTAAYAVSGPALKSAQIRQFNTKNDSGSPEQNPLQREAEAFMKMYEFELSKREPQNRYNLFRSIT